MKSKNIHIIVQARSESTRMKNKLLRKIKNKSIVKIIYERLIKVKLADKIIFAIPKNKFNANLKKLIRSAGAKYIFQGNNDDVLSRYFETANYFKSDIIIRITADCPFLDPNIISEMLKLFLKSKLDYLSNVLEPTFPDGYDVEIFNFESLRFAHLNAKTKFHREHVTPFLISNKKIKKQNYDYKENLSSLRLTLDEEIDLIQLRKIFNYFNSNTFGIDQIRKLNLTKPDFFKINSSIRRNEGGKLSKGNKVWRRAKNVFPNGNMFLSKNPSRFFDLNSWPVYFEKTKGCSIWDLDGKKYNDFSYMGVGTNILGYNNSYVDSKVISTVNKGNSSSLNCSEEVYLAEKLIDLHPWSEMAFFARTGGEANAIAVRLARASLDSNKYKVAVCGYHGWHDWYLSSNLNNKNSLDTHLSPDLKIAGVPSSLKNTVYSFNYNDYESLLKIINNDPKVGVIKMEVEREKKPKNKFLQKVRDLANRKGIVLIFDECTSGFRENFGGIHLNYKVYPDLAMFGKSLGNGYAITSVIGKKEIMSSAKKTFLSSTFWSERIGPTAGIATLQEMEKRKSWKDISLKGKYIKRKINQIAKNNKLNLETYGLDALVSFKFKKNNEIYKQFLIKEMLKKNILATNSLYVSIAHNKKLINKYLDNINDVFYKISNLEVDKIKKILSSN